MAFLRWPVRTLPPTGQTTRVPAGLPAAHLKRRKDLVEPRSVEPRSARVRAYPSNLLNICIFYWRPSALVRLSPSESVAI